MSISPLRNVDGIYANDVPVNNLSDLMRVLETDNLLFTADLMATAAKYRTESRGSHYREDHPDCDDADWNHNVFWKAGSDGNPSPTAGKYRQDPEVDQQVIITQ